MTPSSNKVSKYDAVVIGAGLNGLTAATMLARAGRKVVVLERRPLAGGLASGSEFHPGYHSPGLLHDTTGLLPEVVEELSLSKEGLQRAAKPPPVFTPTREGRGLLLAHDPAEASAELTENGGAGDAENYARYRAFLSRIQPLAQRLFTRLPPELSATGKKDFPSMLSTGLAFRRLGKAEMMELLRIGPMCVADWLDEHFESDLLQAALGAPALRGCWGGPHSPGTNGALLRYETLAGGAVAGGPQALIDSLASAAQAAGVKVITSKPVSSITLTEGKVSGALCKDGEQFHARQVLSSCDPKTTFLSLVGAQALSPSIEEGLRSYRMRGITAGMNLALNRPLRFQCRPDHVVEFARTGQSLIDLEKSFDPVKYDRFGEELALEIYVPSVSRPGAAPDGHASVAILAHGVPYSRNGGWDEGAREQLGDVIIRTISSYADNLDASIVARELLTPEDIEKRYSVTGGHLYHGEQGLDQLMVRPAMQCDRYATPIEGLYLCGSGSHPGGGITCAPGFIAASTLLKRG